MRTRSSIAPFLVHSFTTWRWNLLSMHSRKLSSKPQLWYCLPFIFTHKLSLLFPSRTPWTPVNLWCRGPHPPPLPVFPKGLIPICPTLQSWEPSHDVLVMPVPSQPYRQVLTSSSSQSRRILCSLCWCTGILSLGLQRNWFTDSDSLVLLFGCCLHSLLSNFRPRVLVNVAGFGVRWTDHPVPPATLV